MGKESALSKRVLNEQLEEYEKKQIREYFNNKLNGICVEVGSNEPTNACSQSWHLEDKLNWKCILIEPNPDLVKKTKELRKNTTVINSACVSNSSNEYVELHIPLSNESKEITFHASVQINADEHNYKEHKTIKVKAETLTEILVKEDIQDIDILSIDVEGTELEVLKGIDFNIFRPKLILLEDKHLYLSKHRLLKKNAYILVQRLNRNCWYIPEGMPKPKVKIINRIKLMKRLYLSLFFNKIKYSLRHKTLMPFKTL